MNADFQDRGDIRVVPYDRGPSRAVADEVFRRGLSWAAIGTAGFSLLLHLRTTRAAPLGLVGEALRLFGVMTVAWIARTDGRKALAAWTPLAAWAVLEAFATSWAPRPYLPHAIRIAPLTLMFAGTLGPALRRSDRAPSYVDATARCGGVLTLVLVTLWLAGDDVAVAIGTCLVACAAFCVAGERIAQIATGSLLAMASVLVALFGGAFGVLALPHAGAAALLLFGRTRIRTPIDLRAVEEVFR